MGNGTSLKKLELQAQCLAAQNYILSDEDNDGIIEASLDVDSSQEGSLCPATFSVNSELANKVIDQYAHTPAALNLQNFSRYGAFLPDYAVTEKLYGNSPNPIRISKVGYEFPNGAKLEGGIVRYFRGQYFVDFQEHAKISGIEVTESFWGQRLLFFDGSAHSKAHRYLSINIDEKFLTAKNIQIFFDPNNCIFPGPEKTLLDIEGHDSIVTFTNRTNAGNIPLIIVNKTSTRMSLNGNQFFMLTSNEGETPRIDIQNGQSNYWEYSCETENHLSSPFEINFVDSSGNLGNFLVRTLCKDFSRQEEGYSLVNNEGKLRLFDAEGKRYFVSSLMEGLSLSDLRMQFPHITFTGPGPDNSTIREWIDTLHKVQRATGLGQGLTQINFFTRQQELKQACSYKRNDKLEACAEPGRINISVNFIVPTLFHELAHVATFYAEETDSLFEAEWLEVAGEIYGKHVIPQNKKSNDNGWKGRLNHYGPAFGCVSSYGGYNYYEDVATFVEETAKFSPGSFFQPLLSANNPYHKIYRKKLDLLVKYQFISDEQYRAIVNYKGSPL